MKIGGRRIPAVGVTLKDSRYVMLDELTGRILWRQRLEPAISWMQSIGTPASRAGTILVPLFHSPASGELVAIRANDGAVLWRARTEGIYEAPVVWRSFVLVAPARGTIAAFDLRSGARAGRISVGSKLYGRGLTLDGDTLFVAGRGELWAYRLRQ